MQGHPLLTASLLLSALVLLPGCSSSQMVDDETAAEAALDEAGSPSTEEALSEGEQLTRKIREEEAARGPEKVEPRKKGGGLVVLPPIEREESDEESDPDLDVGGSDPGGGGDDEPDESVGAIEAESGADLGYVEDE